MHWLEIKNVTYGYLGERKILQNFSTSLNKCGIYSCVGDSGTGKSTFSQLLAGYLTPEAGTIVLSGKEITNACKRVFYVSQDDDLFPWLNLEDQLKFFFRRASANLDLNDALAWVELDGEKKKYPAELSGGMRKRLSLLRATVFCPELLILDETLSSIEVDLRIKILNNLSKYWQANSTGVILISHDKIPMGDFSVLGEIKISNARLNM
jgi:NitT/TauT family transport system ATP-binding protein